MAQLVEHHLAKVRVASSNLVVRSTAAGSVRVSRVGPRVWWSGREARQRPAKPSTRVQIPSPPRRSEIRSAGRIFPARLAQRESTTLTLWGSLVQSQYRAPKRRRPTPAETAGRVAFVVVRADFVLDLAAARRGEECRHDDVKRTRPARVAKGRNLGDGLRRGPTDLRELRDACPLVPVPLPPARVLHVRAVRRAHVVLRLPDLLRLDGARATKACPCRRLGVAAARPA